MSLDAYNRLIALLDERGARYRLIDHVRQGRTEIISHIRNNDIRHAAKCIVLMVKLGKKTTKYVLAVMPGHRRVDFSAVKALFAASYVSFASTETAERLAGSPSGKILPFALNAELELIADPSLKDSPELISTPHGWIARSPLMQMIILRSPNHDWSGSSKTIRLTL